MLDTPFSPWPSFTAEESEAVSRVLLSNRVNYWTGLECREFEKEFAAFCGSEYAVALSNGTVALELALKVLGIGPGDEVIVTPRSYIASVSCVVLAGAQPVFADVDANSQNITAESIRRALSEKTKAIICVHLAGWPCEMEPILNLAKERNLFVIEDCAQAHGAKYMGRPVGSWGDVAAWSFCQDKIMTTGGEGGMLTTNRKELWEKAWSYKDHGKSFAAVKANHSSKSFKWVHEDFGTNFRMTELQAVIGRIQLMRMSEWHQKRTENAKYLFAGLSDCKGLRLPSPPQHLAHAWYKFYAFLELDKLQTDWTRDRVMSEINSLGVPCYSGSCPEIYLEKVFETSNLRPEQPLLIAKKLGLSSLMFLVHPTLKREELQKTVEVTKTVLGKATNSQL